MAAHHPAPQFGADRPCLRSAESVCGGRVYSRACEYQQAGVDMQLAVTWSSSIVS